MTDKCGVIAADYGERIHGHGCGELLANGAGRADYPFDAVVR